MWTLFKREFEDVWFYWIAAILVVGGSIAWAELLAAPDHQGDCMLGGFLFGYVLLCILLLVVGANRMVFDRANGISAFYTGHLITRGRVFIVRLLLGALFAVLFYIPLAYWFLWRFLRLPDATFGNVPVGKLGGAAFFLFLLLLGCYNLGLRMGLYNKRLIYTIGTACLGVLFFSFVILKGFGFEATVILVALIAAMTYSTWRDYSTIAL